MAAEIDVLKQLEDRIQASVTRIQHLQRENEMLAKRLAESEQRFVSIGLGSAGELLVVVWMERDDECRVISARRATRKERTQYEG